MTKRKAIEAAMERWVEARRHRVAVDIEDVIAGSCVEKAYELGRIAGRIAGLREGAKMIPRYDNHGWITRDGLRARADRLAKKARSK